MADIDWEDGDVEMRPVQSSNISAIGYDKDAKDLHVVFYNGAKYIYSDVEPNMWKNFKRASSKGKFMWKNIRGSYSFRKE